MKLKWLSRDDDGFFIIMLKNLITDSFGIFESISWIVLLDSYEFFKSSEDKTIYKHPESYFEYFKRFSFNSLKYS